MDPALRPRSERFEQGEPHWGGPLIGGTAAGLAFVLLELSFVWFVLGQSPASLIRSSAAAAGQVAPGVGILIVATALHFGLAIAYGVVVALAARPFVQNSEWWIGAAAGLVVYVVNFFYVLGPALPAAGELPERVSILSPWYSISLW